MESKELLRLAQDATTKAYAPYSNFFVGAALLTSSGKVYQGCNVENSSYGVTICAERVAVVTAVAAGERNFEAMAVVASSEDFVYPCGLCRQFLAEFNINLKIIAGSANEVREHKLRELLPYAFVAFETGEQRAKKTIQPSVLL